MAPMAACALSAAGLAATRSLCAPDRLMPTARGQHCRLWYHARVNHRHRRPPVLNLTSANAQATTLFSGLAELIDPTQQLRNLAPMFPRLSAPATLSAASLFSWLDVREAALPKSAHDGPGGARVRANRPGEVDVSLPTETTGHRASDTSKGMVLNESPSTSVKSM